jgi:hypothetical protein
MPDGPPQSGGQSFHLSNKCNAGSVFTWRWLGRGPVPALGHDSAAKGIIDRRNLCAPITCNALGSLRWQDAALLVIMIGAGQMKRQALGLGQRVCCDARQIIQLRIEIGHRDLNGAIIAGQDLWREVRLGALFPRTNALWVKVLKAGDISN